jgi:nitroreductase
MELFEIIKNRRSIRSYKKQNLPSGTIEQLLEAARWAPSAGNVQSCEFVVVTTAEVKEELSKVAYGQKDLVEAPVVIVVCANEDLAAQRYGARGKTLYCLQDTAAAVQNILLTAYSLGLGSCWIGAFKEEEVAKLVNAPKGIRPVAMIPVGYPNQNPQAPRRKPLSETMHKETF